MTNITPIFGEALKAHNARLADPAAALENIDEFLKEAYRINSHIAALHIYLKNIRSSYLSKSQPRRPLPSRNDSASSARHRGGDKNWQPLTDRQREEIDAETKQLLRELNASIRNLADAEQLRQNTESTLLRKKHGKLNLSSLGAWAAGGGESAKSFEQARDEARAQALTMHRESVLWFLRQKLQEAGKLQAEMMETRITREMERNKSVLYKTRGQVFPEFAAGLEAHAASSPVPQSSPATNRDYQAQAAQQSSFEDELSQEQIQMFEKDNQDMLKQYEATLDQVRTAEKSLVEISELQTQLVNNLAMQAEHIDHLVVDSMTTAENVGGGNRELKRASERKSTAKYVFYASCGLSFFLVVYDLLI